VGSSYFNGGVDVISQTPTAINFTKAAQWFNRALRRGCRHALRPLALSLYSCASSRSSSSSLQFKQEASRNTCDVMTECADAGHIECVALLADMLYKGSMGCPQNYAAGGQRAVAAGQAGSITGACLLASMIADGRAFTRRPEEALKWARVCSMHGGGDSASAVVQTLRQEVSPEEDEVAQNFALKWRMHRAIDLAD
jgi:TPR repeat protein